ncbi:aspartate--tRNA ligase [Candidatus Endomicrobiellum trichonymphae]|uniref:Aspartate--tRNA(Asp/Asn) ligase n=1 Tax=Endomicrobium trichonymphae TaxID=1408204 RepID=SYDND_ENDTX|nr:aspartate--tRNA ligase [Candidatus Endomicrobium trichonymphae]B1GZY6.1 RecName: Full=Aspartate--tRNA(Asp/Asn) ligase; AltName: Full=Aspartyl-tRNA synthetase; Short=AspRS; AltName: Full=Non-discriminating aspartyl-tRNA synthetase; Short=ND-AspRS [Candidatus Endomicrobium trichonymphae]BAG13818.1 aspartyl-tRNA synthetase [Candidatus Endomicrobium trichonymphae]
MKRSGYCGDIRESSIGKEIAVCGWVHSRRDHGGVIFIDLRDREGILQIVFQPENKEIFEAAEKLRSEYVIAVKGWVRNRPFGTLNTNMSTGNVELVAVELKILNTSPGLPFEISDYIDTSEELRLKYRYLDLRRPNLQKNFVMRHKISKEIRNFLNEEGFLEIETPFLTKSTPEGARDFLVPSRLHHGNFFALPQSPQLFKQILMSAGFDKYYQIVRCFRDEDLRADRQPEFTQVDVEMSFVDEEDVMVVIERMLARVFKMTLNLDIKMPFERMPYSEAMLRFGSDKPDTRFEVEIKDFSRELKNSGFSVFSSVISKGGIVRGLCIPKGASFSRSEIAGLTKFVGEYGAKGLVWMKITDTGADSNIVKYFKEYEIRVFISKLNAKSGDLIVFLADEEKTVAQGLGALRLKVGRESGLIDKNKFNFLWVVDFPLMEWDKEEQRWQALHHPFTLPKDADSLTKENAGRAKAKAYDVVLNGIELGGGSIRIHKSGIQKKIFNILDISDESAEKKFGFLLKALTYGAPPHGGAALGFDRLCALISGEDSIREVIAFPKTQKAVDPLSNAPAAVSDNHLKELGLQQIEN